MNKNLNDIIEKKNPNKIYTKEGKIVFSKKILVKEIENAKYTLK
jgi:hypothetical protein